MNTNELISGLIGILILIISYFLIQTMKELKDTTKLSSKNEGDIALLKQETNLKHNRLEEKLDDLKDSIIDLTEEIKILNFFHKYSLRILTIKK